MLNTLKEVLTPTAKKQILRQMVTQAQNGDIAIGKYLLNLELKCLQLEEQSKSKELAKLKSIIKKYNHHNKYSPYPRLDPDNPTSCDSQPMNISVTYVAPKNKSVAKPKESATTNPSEIVPSLTPTPKENKTLLATSLLNEKENKDSAENSQIDSPKVA